MAPVHIPSRNERARLLVYAIAVASIAFHLTLASKLAWLTQAITQSEHDGDDWRKLEGIKALVAIARLFSWSSALVAALGLWGIAKVPEPLHSCPLSRHLTALGLISFGMRA